MHTTSIQTLACRVVQGISGGAKHSICWWFCRLAINCWILLCLISAESRWTIGIEMAGAIEKRNVGQVHTFIRMCQECVLLAVAFAGIHCHGYWNPIAICSTRRENVRSCPKKTKSATLRRLEMEWLTRYAQSHKWLLWQDIHRSFAQVVKRIPFQVYLKTIRAWKIWRAVSSARALHKCSHHNRKCAVEKVHVKVSKIIVTQVSMCTEGEGGECQCNIYHINAHAKRNEIQEELIWQHQPWQPCYNSDSHLTEERDGCCSKMLQFQSLIRNSDSSF